MQTPAEKERQGGKAGRTSKNNDKGEVINDGDNKSRNIKQVVCGNILTGALKSPAQHDGAPRATRRGRRP